MPCELSIGERHARLRDYYRVEDSEGRRYWIYRHEQFGDRPGAAPDWYLHGLFG
jgi:protein ImuB